VCLQDDVDDEIGVPASPYIVKEVGLQGYLPFLYVVSQKMIPHFYVLGFGMEHWVLCNAYGTCAITLKWDMGILLTKATHGVYDPKELRATTSCGNVLCLGSGLSNTRLFAKRPRHQR
jgi:hypothetical protein